MTSVQAVVAILAAIGGVGGLVQLVNAFRAWRDGVKQREEAADERLLARYERRVDELELRVAHGEEYIGLLVQAVGELGGKIPPRPPMRRS